MANENFIDPEAEIVVKKFPIVCVAGSAGRPDASVRLLQHLPCVMGASKRSRRYVATGTVMPAPSAT